MVSTIEIFPPAAAAAGCTATASVDRVDVDETSYDKAVRTYYKIDVGAANGWMFDRFEFTELYRAGATSIETPYTIPNAQYKPFETDYIHYVSPSNAWKTTIISFRVVFKIDTAGKVLYGASGAIIFGSSGGVLRGG